MHRRECRRRHHRPREHAPGNGVRTPQQLFEQLQRMRQGQQNSQPTQQDSPLLLRMMANRERGCGVKIA